MLKAKLSPDRTSKWGIPMISEQKVFSKYMYRLPVYSERLTWTKIDMPLQPVINFSVHVLTKFLLPVFKCVFLSRKNMILEFLKFVIPFKRKKKPRSQWILPISEYGYLTLIFLFFLSQYQTLESSAKVVQLEENGKEFQTVEGTPTHVFACTY